MFQDSPHLPSCCRGVVTSPLSPPLVGKLTARDAGTSRSIASADLLVAPNRVGYHCAHRQRLLRSLLFHPLAPVFPDVRIRQANLD
jgi:hypothetical protein